MQATSRDRRGREDAHLDACNEGASHRTEGWRDDVKTPTMRRAPRNDSDTGNPSGRKFLVGSSHSTTSIELIQIWILLITSAASSVVFSRLSLLCILLGALYILHFFGRKASYRRGRDLVVKGFLSVMVPAMPVLFIISFVAHLPHVIHEEGRRQGFSIERDGGR